ncbi:unnamed protein product [Allacma fusca]|uniref:Transposase n=1 Tax=Allacma fusca TaxID=39272 RepID=A0A8J2KI09_9HEXA|nr:unnamed protein product [Allacma fusca]
MEKLFSADTLKRKIVSLYDARKNLIIKKLQANSSPVRTNAPVLAITTDNASNCNTMFEEFSFFARQKGLEFDTKNNRVRCLAHIVNLACKDAIAVLKKLSVTEVLTYESTESESETDDNVDSISSDSVTNGFNSSNEDEPVPESPPDNKMSLYDRIGKSIQKSRRSSILRDSFKQSCRFIKLKHKHLLLDMEVRWNTTHCMLKRLKEMRQAFEHLLSNEPTLRCYQLSSEEWDLIDEMIELLEPFWKMPLYNHLENFKFENGKGVDVCKAATSACEKLNKYYPTSDGLVYVMGLLLDPRCKTEWYKSVGIPSKVSKQNKKMALDYWDKFYKPKDGNALEPKNTSDILAAQVKRAKMSRT